MGTTTDSLPTRAQLRGTLEDWQARIMFWLSCLFLVSLSAIFHVPFLRVLAIDFLHFVITSLVHVDEEIQLVYSSQAVLTFGASFATLWLIFVVEAVARFLLRDRRDQQARKIGHLIGVSLAPPFRIGARRFADGPQIWLPFVGWRTVDRHVRRKLERFFSVPMIIMALLVLPLLVIHAVWEKQVEADARLALFLEIGNGIIWLAFAFEFVVMLSVADRKLQYCGRHWLDLAIVALPILEFMPALRAIRLVSQVSRLQQLSSMARVYRLRGLMMKLWRAILLLDVIRRLTGQSLEKRLKRLQELVASKEEEIEDLRKEISQIEAQIAEKAKGELSRSTSSKP